MTTRQITTGAEAPALCEQPFRVFNPESAPGDPRDSLGLSPAMTLAEFFARFVKAVWFRERGASRSTIAEYQQSIDYWVAFTADPRLIDVDDKHTSDFVVALQTLPGMKSETTLSPHTVAKHCRHVQTCLSLAGPRGPRNKKAQRLLVEVPYLDPPEAIAEEVEDNFTLAEIEALLKAGQAMNLPRKLPVAHAIWWPSLLLACYNVAERRGGMLRVTWAGLLLDRPEKYPHGRLRFGRSIRKGKKRSQTVPLNEISRAAIEIMRTGRERAIELNPGLPIWGWPSGRADREWGSWSNFHKLFRESLLPAAGIPPERRFGLHGLRKAAATEMAEVSLLASQFLLGHQNAATTMRSYVGRQQLNSGVQQLKQPSGAAAALDSQQRRLFD